MSRTPRKSCVVLAMFAVLLGACDRVSTDTSITSAETDPSTTVSTGDSTGNSTVTSTTPTTEAPPSPQGMGDLTPEIQAEITKLSSTVEELRGLEFLQEPDVNVVTDEELEALVRADLEENAEDLDTDAALYAVLGLVDSGTDLLQTYLDLYGEQVAGFYDTDTKELVVPLRSDEFSPLERSTIVHELTHAVTDQHFDLGANYDKLFDEQRFDEAVAFQALIEGDAVATELTYLQGLSPEDQQSLFQESLEADTTALDSAPRFIQESLVFPYTSGFEFVSSLLGDGQEAVDAAYAKPPVSTEQVITPGDYQVDAPATVEVATPSIDGYEVIYESVWGELGFELMFNQILGGRPEAVEGWGGDRYVTLFDGTDVVMVLEYVGDAPEDVAEMTQALLDYAETGMDVDDAEERNDASWFSGEDFAFVDRSGDTVVFVVASDPEVGAQVAEGIVDQPA